MTGTTYVSPSAWQPTRPTTCSCRSVSTSAWESSSITRRGEPSEERAREPPAIPRGDGIVASEVAEERDHHAPDAVAAVRVGLLQVREQPLERRLVVAALERLDDV